ncbi:hypothetical protein SASPL_124121 [Salvia splendens]|uniref:Large ribosomal subunit protein eL20 domain-containing protein n=1 Tax=Salvia splendens TaxID=180675 RepID=A0A8X8XSF8_SALSN|nr:hypothetical protein SASPL_124121 [Salvia splendens]
MSEEGGGKTLGVSAAAQSSPPPPNYYYGTFQGVANYQPQPDYSVIGIPQPVPPSAISAHPPHYYPPGYHAVPGHVVAHGPFREERLPCFGVGLGWLLFITGFFLGAIPWYIGAFLLLCVRMDYREKPGLIACGIAALLAALAVTLVRLIEFEGNAINDPYALYVLQFHQYQVVGRALPTETEEHPKIYRMKLWATNEVRAKSKFWYFLRKLKKVKKSNGQVLAINEIFEKNPTTIKNYGIWLRYQSRTGYHNMYKEYRDTTLNGGVEQMYTEMASRHRVRSHCIQIIKTATVPAKLCKRESTKQFHDSKIKFPLVYKKVRPPSRKLKTTYKATRPNLFM